MAAIERQSATAEGMRGGTESETAVVDDAGDESLLDALALVARVRPGDEGYALTRDGIGALVAEMVTRPAPERRATQAVVDAMIADLDRRLGEQVDQILHHASFQQLESAWRGLKFLVDRTDFRENIRIQMLSVSQDKLRADFREAPELSKSGLYKNLYTAEYGQFGGLPFGAIVADYAFGPGARDIELLTQIAGVAAVSHAPFVAAAAPAFFGIDDFGELPNLKDLSSIFEGPQMARWKSLRDNEDARYLGLTLPRFLLRVPYGPDTEPATTFDYTEGVGPGNQGLLWGNAAFAFATRLTESFADYRWCANVIGPQGGGAVRNLPIYTYEALGEQVSKVPTEVLLSERREFELAEQGFIGLTMRKNSDNAAFFSANSVQRPKFFGATQEGRDAELNYKLGTQLPYMFIVSRLAHYIKVIQRENIGTWKEKSLLESELNKWIRQYVADMDSPAEGVRSRRPLRQAEIHVADIDGEPGWYRVDLKVRPHFKYMGASFTLSLVSKLEKM